MLVEQSLAQGLQWLSPLKIKRKLAVLSAAKLSLKTCVPYNVIVVRILRFVSSQRKYTTHYAMYDV